MRPNFDYVCRENSMINLVRHIKKKSKMKILLHDVPQSNGGDFKYQNSSSQCAIVMEINGQQNVSYSVKI